jgi:sugar (glycoside-pentoside-hexuronide) transporter
MATALILCFTAPALGPTGKLVWTVMTYNVLMMTYAANNIPYCALSGVMTDDSQERTSLASWRFVCAMLAALIVNMFTSVLVKYFGQGNAALGYQVTMAVWSSLAVAMFLVTFTFTKERIAPSPNQRSSVRQDLVDLSHNGPWIALFSLAVLIYVELALRGGTLLYYFEHYLQSKNVFGWVDNFGLFNGIGLTFAIVGVAMSKSLVVRFGKRATFLFCLLLSSVFMALFAIVPPNSFAALVVLQMLLQLSFGPTIPILWAMMADVVDYSEWRTGRRSTALAFASIVFGLKIGSGIGGWLNGQLLELFGYSATGPLGMSATRGIVMLVSIIPAIALLFGASVLLFYHLDDKLIDQIEQALKARRSDPELTASQT